MNEDRKYEDTIKFLIEAVMMLSTPLSIEERANVVAGLQEAGANLAEMLNRKPDGTYTPRTK